MSVADWVFWRAPACSPVPLKGEVREGVNHIIRRTFDPLPLRSFGAKRPPLFKGRFETSRLAAALMPAAGDKDLPETDHELEADQDHDDDLESRDWHRCRAVRNALEAAREDRV
jgi:hypothetical protein